MDNKIPAAFICPISDEIMHDPVIDPTSGVTYDRQNIVDWINECIKKEQEPTSPNTREKLTEAMLIPNRSLREAIEDYQNRSVAHPMVINNSNIDKLEIKASQLAADPMVINNSNIDKLEIELTGCNSPEGDPITMLTIKSPKQKIRVPSNICCVIDISGSMDNEADIKQNVSESSKYGFSLLDIVKHAVLTIIDGLDECDYFSLITFSTYAEICLTPTKMTFAGKQVVKDELNKLTPDGSTNLWDGLIKAFGMLNKFNTDHNLTNSHILLLTDGEPNIEPPNGNGYLKSLQMYKQQFGYPANVHTFGFGYKLDSSLLNEISQECNGTFAFIPDASFVGTIFINLVSNILTTIANKFVLTISDIQTPLLPFKHSIANNQTIVDLGSVTLEQDQYIILPLNVDELNITLDYQLYLSEAPVHYTTKLKVNSVLNQNILVQKFRLEAIVTILEIYNYCSIGHYQLASDTLQSLLQSPISGLKDPYVTALFQDLQGQVKEAIDEKYFQRWGRHYLLSLTNAHLKMLCNNFKDPGVQYYGGEQFKQLRNMINILFDQLPPPKPSHVNKFNASNYQSVNSMRTFNNSSAPCFHPNSIITLSNNQKIPITSLKKGDSVLSDHGSIAHVLCIIKYLSVTPVITFSKLNTLLITPWHPVRLNENFIFPNKVANSIDLPCDHVYNVVLDSGHILFVNDIECVTLGHSFVDGDAKHPYFGSQTVIDDLRKFPGWNNGLIILTSNNIYRNIESGLIEHFV